MQERRRAIAYERWNEVRGECLAISERILTESVHTAPGLAAQVLAHIYVERGGFAQSGGAPILYTAAAMLGETLPAHLNDGTRQKPDRSMTQADRSA